MSEQRKSCQERVVDWLNTEGYRLEHRAFHVFKEAGLKPALGYHPPTSGQKPREIDVTAWSGIQQASAAHPICIVRLVCECKYSKEKPWALIQSDLPANLFVDWWSTPKSPNLQQQVEKVRNFTDILKNSPHFRTPGTVSYNLIQIFEKKSQEKDDAYEAMQKICNAAWDIAEVPDKRGDSQTRIVVIPCIIVEAPLFEAKLNVDSGLFEAKAVSRGRVSWQGCHDGTVFDVIHTSVLEDYAEDLKKTFIVLPQVMNRF